MSISLIDLLISVQSPDGSFEASNAGFQQVTRRVLRAAPCSVAILVDRGFGGLHQVGGLRRNLRAECCFGFECQCE